MTKITYLCTLLVFNFLLVTNLEAHSQTSSEIQRVRLDFTTPTGFTRHLLLAFTPDNAASDGFDYGYDASNADEFPNDMFWIIDGANYVIQGVGAYSNTKFYPLYVNITNACAVNISLNRLENFDTEINVFIYDSLMNVYAQINKAGFEVMLESGLYENRFYIAFSDNTTLSLSDNEIDTPDQVSYLARTKEIYIKSDTILDVENVHLLNTIGQIVMSWSKKEFNNFGSKIKIPVSNIPEGTYIIKVETNNSTINKKVII